MKNRVFTGSTEDIFQFINNPYNLRNNRIILKKRNKTVFYRTESPSPLAPGIWGTIPQSLKDETEQSPFKTKIKTWTASECPCRLCKK